MSIYRKNIDTTVGDLVRLLTKFSLLRFPSGNPTVAHVTKFVIDSLEDIEDERKCKLKYERDRILIEIDKYLKWFDKNTSEEKNL